QMILQRDAAAANDSNTDLTHERRRVKRERKKGTRKARSKNGSSCGASAQSKGGRVNRMRLRRTTGYSRERLGKGRRLSFGCPILPWPKDFPTSCRNCARALAIW